MVGYKPPRAIKRRFILNTHIKAIHEDERETKAKTQRHTETRNHAQMFAVQATTRIGTYIFTTHSRERFTFFSFVRCFSPSPVPAVTRVAVGDGRAGPTRAAHREWGVATVGVDVDDAGDAGTAGE